MATSLNTITFTSISDLLSQLNSNFAIIENSPLFKGIQGITGAQGVQGVQGFRGNSFYFINRNASEFSQVPSTVQNIQDLFNDYSTNVADYLNKQLPDDLINDDIFLYSDYNVYRYAYDANATPNYTLTNLGSYFNANMFDIGMFRNYHTFEDAQSYLHIGDVLDNETYNENTSWTDISTTNNHNFFGIDKKHTTSNWVLHSYTDSIPSTTILGDTTKFINIFNTTPIILNDVDYRLTRNSLPTLIIEQNDNNSGILIHFGDQNSKLKYSSHIYKSQSQDLIISATTNFNNSNPAILQLTSPADNINDSVSQSYLRNTNFNVTNGKLRSKYFSTRYINSPIQSGNLYIGQNVDVDYDDDTNIMPNSDDLYNTSTSVNIISNRINLDFPNNTNFFDPSQATYLTGLQPQDLQNQPNDKWTINRVPYIPARILLANGPYYDSSYYYNSTFQYKYGMEEENMIRNSNDYNRIPRWQDLLGLTQLLWGYYEGGMYVYPKRGTQDLKRNFTTSYHNQDFRFRYNGIYHTVSGATDSTATVLPYMDSDDNTALNYYQAYKHSLNLPTALKLQSYFAVGSRIVNTDNANNFAQTYNRVDYPFIVAHKLKIKNWNPSTTPPQETSFDCNYISIGQALKCFINYQDDYNNGTEFTSFSPFDFADESNADKLPLVFDVNWFWMRMSQLKSSVTFANKGVLTCKSATGYYNNSVTMKNESDITLNQITSSSTLNATGQYTSQTYANDSHHDVIKNMFQNIVGVETGMDSDNLAPTWYLDNNNVPQYINGYVASNANYCHIRTFDFMKYATSNEDNVILTGRDFNMLVDMIDIILHLLSRHDMSPVLVFTNANGNKKFNFTPESISGIYLPLFTNNTPLSIETRRISQTPIQPIGEVFHS